MNIPSGSLLHFGISFVARKHFGNGPLNIKVCFTLLEHGIFSYLIWYPPFPKRFECEGLKNQSESEGKAKSQAGSLLKNTVSSFKRLKIWRTLDPCNLIS